MPMERNVIEELSQALPRRRRAAIARELQAHVDDTRQELLLAGWQPEAATREAIARFGATEEIAGAFADVYRPSRRVQLSLALTLATGMLAGVYGLGGTLASATAAHRNATTHVHRGVQAHHR